MINLKHIVNEILREGREIVFYRGLNKQMEPGQVITPREGYALFGSSNIYVARSYSHGVGKVYRLKVNATRVIEYPVRKTPYGNEFSKFDFDDRARALQPGEVLVARSVYDSHPGVSPDYVKTHDPERFGTYASDIYAVGKGTKIEVLDEFNESITEGESYTDAYVIGPNGEVDKVKNHVDCMRLPKYAHILASVKASAEKDGVKDDYEFEDWLEDQLDTAYLAMYRNGLIRALRLSNELMLSFILSTMTPKKVESILKLGGRKTFVVDLISSTGFAFASKDFTPEEFREVALNKGNK